MNCWSSKVLATRLSCTGRPSDIDFAALSSSLHIALLEHSLGLWHQHVATVMSRLAVPELGKTCTISRRYCYNRTIETSNIHQIPNTPIFSQSRLNMQKLVSSRSDSLLHRFFSHFCSSTHRIQEKWVRKWIWGRRCISLQNRVFRTSSSTSVEYRRRSPSQATILHDPDTRWFK